MATKEKDKDKKNVTPAKAKPTAKGAARKAVARPATRTVTRRAAPVAPAAQPAPAAAAPATRVERRAVTFPTAPAGHAPLVGGDGGSIELPQALTGAKERSVVLFQAYTAARANARLGTAATKNRARVAGGGAKPWRQKGTGRARQGSTRAPHWRHGGVVFGPNGRTYDQRLPEKMRKAAFAEAFSTRAADGRVLVFGSLPFDGERPRSRDVVEWLAGIGDTGRTLIVVPEADERLGRAAANVADVEVRTPGTLRLEDVLRTRTLLVMRDALDALAQRAGAESATEGSVA